MDKEPIIFIVCGKARSGKTTVTEIIKKYYQNKNIKCVNLMYAESIKNYAKKIIDWDGKEETKPRTFLQQLGTEIIRNKIDDDFFIKRMLDDIKVYSYFFDVVTISDARFIKEIEEPKKQFNNVVVIKILKPNFVSDLTQSELNHSSENGLNDYDNYDYVISNDATLEVLEQKVFDLLDKIKTSK